MNNEIKPSHIHILCCPDSHYCPYTGVMLTSLLENNRRHHIEIWIATTDNDPDNRRRFLTLEADYDCRIHIIHVMQEEIDSLPDAKGEWPKEMYLRLVLIKTLPVYVSKIIYFDGDIIVNTDIYPLWEHPMDGNAAVAVPDINHFIFDNYQRLNISSPYFNSGVMVIDIDRCRQLDLTDRCLQILSATTLEYPDQDALNMVLDGHVAYAPLQWNLVTGFLLTNNLPMIPPDIRNLAARLASGRRKAIIHYTGEYKPWLNGTFMFHPLHAVWRRYYRISPWRDLPIFKTLPCPMLKSIAIMRIKMLHALGINTPYSRHWSVTSGRYSRWRSLFR